MLVLLTCTFNLRSTIMNISKQSPSTMSFEVIINEMSELISEVVISCIQFTICGNCVSIKAGCHERGHDLVFEKSSWRSSLETALLWTRASAKLNRLKCSLKQLKLESQQTHGLSIEVYFNLIRLLEQALGEPIPIGFCYSNGVPVITTVIQGEESKFGNSSLGFEKIMVDVYDTIETRVINILTPIV